MTLQDIKQHNPSLYAECIAIGINQERERVLPLIDGKARTPSEIFAVQCIKDGSAVTETIKAKHLVIQLEAHSLELKKKQDSEKVVSLVEKRYGIYHE